MIVENTKLESTSSIKVIGVNIDSKLNFDDNVCDMCSEAGRQLDVLQRPKGSLHYDSRMAYENLSSQISLIASWSGYLLVSHPYRNWRISRNGRLNLFYTTMNRTTKIN